jgi:hypothetical protein
VTIHLHLIPRLKMVEQYLHSPIRLYGMVLKHRASVTLLYPYRDHSIYCGSASVSALYMQSIKDVFRLFSNYCFDL